MRTILLVPLLTLGAPHLLLEQATAQAGDSRQIRFTLPFEKAQANAKAQGRMLFLKPIYGGVDKEGAKDYRCGSW